jgi:hypothetical protein
VRLLSRIKEKAREVVREGEDRRASFTAQGMPLRIYGWWHRRTKRQVAKENFCHYCRVIVLWAPLLFIRMMLAKVFGDRQFWICMSLAVTAILIGIGIAFPAGIGTVLAGVVATILAICGLFLGYALAHYVKDKSEFADVPRVVKIGAVVLMVLSFPAVSASFIVSAILIALASRRAKRVYRWIADTRLIKGHITPLGLLLLLVAGSVVALSIVGGWWVIPLSIAGVAVAILVIRCSAEKFGYYLNGRREKRRAAVKRVVRQRNLVILQPVFRTIYDGLYPETPKEEGYSEWYLHYIRRAEEQNSSSVWANIYNYASLYYFPDWKEWDDALLVAVSQELERMRTQTRQSESRVEQRRQEVVRKVVNPFVAIGDFIILLAQFIRVSKWKICPIVELPDDL